LEDPKSALTDIRKSRTDLDPNPKLNRRKTELTRNHIEPFDPKPELAQNFIDQM